MSLPLPPKNAPVMPVGRLVHHKLPLPPANVPRPPMPARPKWTAHKVSYDRAFLHCSGDLTRLEVFRLIGELERIGASL